MKKIIIKTDKFEEMRVTEVQQFIEEMAELAAQKLNFMLVVQSIDPMVDKGDKGLITLVGLFRDAEISVEQEEYKMACPTLHERQMREDALKEALLKIHQNGKVILETWIRKDDEEIDIFI